MADLPASELKTKIEAILKEADLETTSAKKVRMQLEEDLKTDLTGRKEEIGMLIQVNLAKLQVTFRTFLISISTHLSCIVLI